MFLLEDFEGSMGVSVSSQLASLTAPLTSPSLNVVDMGPARIVAVICMGSTTGARLYTGR